MKINELSPAEGSRRARKRVGRGPGSGHGKTSCRGHKGQNSRSGGGVRPGFEGGQMPIHRRLPKRGFKNPFRKEYSVVNVGDLSRFEPNTQLDPDSLQEAGLVWKMLDGVKLLGNGEISQPLVVRIHKISNSARTKIEGAGGKVEIL
ncbi:MAG: 50S ribosomal protein L15 [Deltaproteobacteria bacterium]|jgi:large subunit ribosomal protein L15|nr:50S ribosomal protein L15 [Deltaproteobacteria bacterium]